ncbi:MAG TPA: hypothetical protein VJR89_17340, partial [Polyangiales bacterium]|nr:hypothetical protein [Polyangiales bacterium]
MLRTAAPQLEHLLILVMQPMSLAWPRAAQAAESEAALSARLQAVSAAAVGAARELDVQLAPELPGDAVSALCTDHAIDLIVLDASSVRATSALLLQRKRLPVAILWTRRAHGAGPIRNLGCVALDRRSLAAIAAFLRDRADRSPVAVLSALAMAQEDLAVRLELAGIAANVEVSSLRETGSLRSWLDHWAARERPLDLLVFARVRSALASGSVWAGPVLLLPPLPAAAPFTRRALDICDVVDDRGVLRARVDQSTPLGGL